MTPEKNKVNPFSCNKNHSINDNTRNLFKTIQEKIIF